MTLASTLTRCEPRRRRGGVRVFCGRLMVMLVLSACAAAVLHVVGHWHAATLRAEMRKEVAR